MSTNSIKNVNINDIYNDNIYKYVIICIEF